MKLKNLGEKEFLKTAGSLAKSYRKNAVIVGLIGPLGAGKTTFVKEFVRTLGIKKSKSPSFVITHQYQLPGRLIYHLDFYRLHNQTQLEPLGLAEILSGKHTVLMEWVDKFPELKNYCHILITITINPTGSRNVEIINRKI